MSSFVAVKTVLAPVRWVLRYLLSGLIAIGLSAGVVRMPDDEQIVESAARAEDPRGFPPSGPHPAPGPAGGPPASCLADAVSTVELTQDERLWEAELAEGDAGL